MHWRRKRMIKLPEISEENATQFYADVKKNVYSILEGNKGNPTFQSIIGYCSTAGNLDEEKIKKLVIGNPATLKEAIIQIGVIKDDSVKETFKKGYINFCSRKFGRNWAQRLGVTVCPYCNRSYIFTSNRKGTRPQYDHYFPKSIYPYLALSMYNLVPCCAVCNGLKRDSDTMKSPIIYPYQESYGDQITFDEKGVNVDTITAWLGAAQKYEVKIQYKDGIPPDFREKVEQAVKIFQLEDLYSKHSDYIRDILRTAYIYRDDYLEDLVAQYPDLFHSKQEAKDFVFLNYLDENDWGKRVLAKLTHDIAKKVSN